MNIFLAIIFSIFTNIAVLVAPMYTLVVYDKVLSSGSVDTLTWLTLITVALLIYSIFMDLIRNIIFSAIGDNIYLSKRSDAISVILNYKLIPFEHKKSLFSDLCTLHGYYSYTFKHKFDLPFSLVFMCCIALFHLTLFYVVICIGCVVISLSFWASNSLVENDKSHKIEEALHSPNLIEKVEQINNSTVTSGNIQSFAVSSPLQKGILLLANVIMVCIGAMLATQNELTAGGLIASIMLSSKALMPLMHFGSVINGERALRKVNARFSGIKEKFTNDGTREVLTPDNNEIFIEDIKSFSNNGSLMLSVPSYLKLPANSTVAIVGPSSSGKSSFLKAIGGFITLKSGKILIGNKPTSEVKRDFISYSSNNSILESLTLTEFIYPKGNIERVFEVINTLDFNNTIKDLPDGLNTKISNIPNHLLTTSFKEFVRLGSALASDSKILLLDEFTPNITKDVFEKYIENIKKQDKTLIVVSNDSCVLRCVDIIVELKKGEIVKVHQNKKEAKNAS